MKNFFCAALVLSALALSSCKKEPVVVKFCLGEDGTSQDCGIACKITKDPRTCDKWADLTKKVCAKVTKAQCQEICEKDENPVACDLAKAMP